MGWALALLKKLSKKQFMACKKRNLVYLNECDDALWRFVRFFGNRAAQYDAIVYVEI